MTIWHDNTEVPAIGKNCIILTQGNMESAHYQICGFSLHGYDDISNGGKPINLSEVKKWCYESDLLKSAFKEPVAYMLRLKETKELYWDPQERVLACLFRDIGEANDMLDRIKEDNEIDTEVVALYE